MVVAITRHFGRRKLLFHDEQQATSIDSGQQRSNKLVACRRKVIQMHGRDERT